MSDKYSVTWTELDTTITLDELVEMHQVLDLIERMIQDAAPKKKARY